MEVGNMEMMVGEEVMEVEEDEKKRVLQLLLLLLSPQLAKGEDVELGAQNAL